MLIREIYHKKAETISQDISVAEALKELLRDKINGQIVLNSSGKVCGVLAIQDIAAHTIPRQFMHNVSMAAALYRRGFFSEMCAEIADKPVKDIMRRDFVTVDLDDNIMAVTADFLKNDLYIVPVMKGDEVIGVVTRSEIKKALAYGMSIPGYRKKETEA